MTKVRRVSIAGILAVLSIFALMAATVTLVQADPGINIDGTLSPGEWSEASSFPLDAHTAYITNDGEFMYVAFDYAVTTGSDFASFNTYKPGAFVPETITAPCVASWGPVWDTIVDEDADNVPETWHREDPTTRYEYSVNTATEMKVPLAELGLSPEDPIKIMFVLNAHMVGTYVYPEDAASFNLATYEELTLLPAPPPPPPAPQPPRVPAVDQWAIVGMIVLFAGLVTWRVRRRRLAS